MRYSGTLFHSENSNVYMCFHNIVIGINVNMCFGFPKFTLSATRTSLLQIITMCDLSFTVIRIDFLKLPFLHYKPSSLILNSTDTGGRSDEGLIQLTPSTLLESFLCVRSLIKRFIFHFTFCTP